MIEAEEWPRLSSLGSGGQSDVFLVRSPKRAQELLDSSRVITASFSGGVRPDEFVRAVANISREDSPSELGALKIFNKLREGGTAPEKRLRGEIEILEENYPNLPKLLAANADEKWMITEYFPNDTLDKHPDTYKGDALGALIAFKSLVETIAHLHRTGVVHRDIKPANVFIAGAAKLVPGDFGIAHRPSTHERLTVTHERVGPWDYMPQWADTGERLEEVHPSFDVYMLGKLLWCMVSGKLRLPREYHRRGTYDLSVLFPNDRRMNAINSILDKCLVEQESECLRSGIELLKCINETLSSLDGRLVIHNDGQMDLPCLACGRGVYKEVTRNGRAELTRLNNNNVHENSIFLRVFSCDVCTHYTFFAPNFPHQAALRNWQKL